MKVSWGALGITIGLILVATSILAVGFMAEKRISRLTDRLTALDKQIAIIKVSIKRNIIAQGYAFSKADAEKRAIGVEDLRKGYALANGFIAEGG